MDNSLETGHKGEQYVATLLSEQGFEVLARNHTIGHKEIDIIAQKDSILHIVEVKTQTSSSPVLSQEHLSRQKIRTIYKAALELKKDPRYRFKVFSVDVAFVTINKTLRKVDITLLFNVDREGVAY